MINKKKALFGKKLLGFFILTMLGLFACALVKLPKNKLDTIPFEYVILDSQGFDSIWLKTIGDINGDGLIDLIAGGHSAGGLVWYENPTWNRHTIDTRSGFRTDGEVVDVDGDGDQDVVALTNDGILWYENPSWTVHLIEESLYHDVEVSDFDGDGDVDLVVRNQSEFGGVGSELYFFRQENPTTWTVRRVECPEGEGLMVVDIDRDGDQDVVVNGSWLENDGDILDGAWTSHTYTTSWTHPHVFVGIGDVNQDGRVDIVLSPSELAGDTYRLSWFEAPENPKSGEWKEWVVEDNIEAVLHYVGAADMDSDGDMDIVSAEMEQGRNPDEVKVYLNQDGAGETWTKQVIGTMGSHSMRILDIGNDGDQDLFGGNFQGLEVQLWLNQTCDSTLSRWQRHVIDSARPWRAIFITAGDIDQDGWQDIITGGWWYKNPGNPVGAWTRNTIGAPLNNMTAVYDFDDDGLVDVVGTMGEGSNADPRFAWARNNGSGSFSVLTNIDQGAGDFLQGVAVGRSEEGGALEVALSWHAAGAGVQMLTVPPDPSVESWSIVTISANSQDEALSLGDIDGDGDQDLLLGTVWLEKDSSSWREHVLHDTISFPYGESNPDRNRLADINQDGRLDAIVGYEAISIPGKLAWYEQGPDSTAIWQEHLIAQVVGPMSLDVADVDLDGDFDVIVGEHNLDKPSQSRLLVLENVDGSGTQWQEHLVYKGDEHHDGAQVIDIDQDGDLDIISIGWEHDNVILYENMSGICRNPNPGGPTPPVTSLALTTTPPILTQTEIPGAPTSIPGNGMPSCLQGMLIPLGLILTLTATRSFVLRALA